MGYKLVTRCDVGLRALPHAHCAVDEDSGEFRFPSGTKHTGLLLINGSKRPRSGFSAFTCFLLAESLESQAPDDHAGRDPFDCRQPVQLAPSVSPKDSLGVHRHLAQVGNDVGAAVAQAALFPCHVLRHVQRCPEGERGPGPVLLALSAGSWGQHGPSFLDGL